VVVFFFSFVANLAAQTQKLDTNSLDAIDLKPRKVAPKFIPKSASKGPVVEKKREYTFASKGVLKSKAARVISMSDGTKIEAPLVDVPLLFRVNSTELADTQSKANLKLLADKLRTLNDAKFCIEGHASAEGDGAHNQKLSESRAKAIRHALIALGVHSQLFNNTIGLGSRHATHPATATEHELAEDRRVLIIREQ